MAEQLTFELPARPALGRDAFFVSASNSHALERLDDWKNWPNKRMMLTGPKGSGKTHLAYVWATESGAQIVESTDLTADFIRTAKTGDLLVVENADRVAGHTSLEEDLFHLYNALGTLGGHLLLIAETAPSRWDIKLPDLKSRLMSMDVIALEPPDDALLSMLLVKLFRDRQIVIDPELIPYLVARMERSSLAAQELVNALDKASLRQKKPVNKRLALSVL